jgi:hypothetical protein
MGLEFGLHRVEKRHLLSTLDGQMQRLGPLILRRLPPLHEPTRRQAVDKRHEIGTFDPQRLGDLDLLAARIGLDKRQCRIFGGPQFMVTETRAELLKHRNLRPAQPIADYVRNDIGPKSTAHRLATWRRNVVVHQKLPSSAMPPSYPQGARLGQDGDHQTISSSQGTTRWRTELLYSRTIMKTTVPERGPSTTSVSRKA